MAEANRLDRIHQLQPSVEWARRAIGGGDRSGDHAIVGEVKSRLDSELL